MSYSDQPLCDVSCRSPVGANGRCVECGVQVTAPVRVLAPVTTKRRSGRMVWLGPVEVETKTYEGAPYVFFDPIGSVNYCDCTYLPDEEIAAMEEHDEQRWMDPDNWLAPDSAPPVLGGNFEFNFRGYRVGVTVWQRWAHSLGMWLNKVLWWRAERKARASS